jgi:membrane protein DedA with SNARE-associated domain
VTHLLVTWGYPALFLVTVLAAMGIPTGSELVIAFAGALASGKVIGGSQHLNLAAVIVVASAGELLGSSFGYGIGRLGGRPLVDRVGRYVLITHHDVDRAEHLFERRGQTVVFFGRFVPLLRSFIGLAAGLAEMSAMRFLVFTAAATAIWCSLFAALGYDLGARWSHDLRGVSDLGYGVAVFIVAVVAIAFAKRFRATRRPGATPQQPSRRKHAIGATSTSSPVERLTARQDATIGDGVVGSSGVSEGHNQIIPESQ